MFKNSLIASVIIHIFLFTVLGSVLNHPGNHRPEQQQNPMLMVALDSDYPFEATLVAKKETEAKISQNRTIIKQGPLFINDQPVATVSNSTAEEAPPAALIISEKHEEEFLESQYGDYQVEREAPNASGSAELDGISTLGPTSPASQGQVDLPDHLPVKLYAPAPGYPYLARRNQWEGVTRLEILVQADGRVGEITVIQSSGYQVLDRAAVKTVKHWRYRPALKNGTGIAWKLRIRINFVLEG